MAKTIRTRYYGPTDFQGSKITARHAGKQLTMPYDHGARDAHLKVAQALADKVYGAAELVTRELTATGYVYDVFPNDLETIMEDS
jgi:hypothetical protein